MKKHIFEITISDGYDTYCYPLEINEDQSIFDVYQKLCKAYRVKPQKTYTNNGALHRKKP